MVSVPSQLREQLQYYGQEHILAWWDQLNDDDRRGLLDQLARIDLEQLRQLYSQRDATAHLPSFDRIKPIPATQLDESKGPDRAAGEEALRRGEVAALMVAGGQGSRLGFEPPKGMVPIGPI